MKVGVILAFASIWFIHVRVTSALQHSSAQSYVNSYRGVSPAYRRAHHPSSKPGASGAPGQFRKKWYPHLNMGHRTRRPQVGSNYMRQRLGMGMPHPPFATPLAAPFPASGPHPTMATVPQNAFKQHHAQQKQQIPVRNPSNKASKWNVPARNLKPQPPPQQQQPVAKPFLSSPKIQTEVEYHIQSNQIPNQPIMIKQLDNEKGPIHTIPAPNLSLADKPKQLQIPQPQTQHYEGTTKLVKPAKHQYQVTEAPEPPLIEKVMQPEPEIPPLKPEHPLQDQIFSLLPVQDGYSYSVLHQPQLQQHLLQQQQPNAYQTMLVQPQFFQPEPAAFLDVHQLHQQQHKQLVSPPEMQSFNYEEPKHEATHSHVSAQYVLHAEEDDLQQQQRHDNDDQDSVSGESFYASLGDKDAAQSFTHFDAGSRRANAKFEQQAGSSRQEEMMIYVPDEQEQFDATEELVQYELPDSSEHTDNVRKAGYGSRIRPKKS